MEAGDLMRAYHIRARQLALETHNPNLFPSRPYIPFNVPVFSRLLDSMLHSFGNPAYPSTIDLHGLTVREAVDQAENHLDNCWYFGWDKIGFITGIGNRSDGGIAKIKPALDEWVKTKSNLVVISQTNAGVIHARIDRFTIRE